MRTNLEIMVGYLSGRDSGSGDSIRRDLGDPTGGASLFLEALREQTRAIFETAGEADHALLAPPAVPPLALVPSEPVATPKARRWPTTLAAAAALLIAASAALWDRHVQSRRFEVALAHRDEAWKAWIGRLESERASREKALLAAARPRELPKSPPVPRPPAPQLDAKRQEIERLLAQLEVGLNNKLAMLEKRLDETEAPPQAPSVPEDPSPSIEQMRRELDGLKRETGAKDKALRQDFLEMRSALMGVMRQLQGLTYQVQNQGPVFVPYPYQVPSNVPDRTLPQGTIPQGLIPGLDHPASGGGAAAPHGGNAADQNTHRPATGDAKRP